MKPTKEEIASCVNALTDIKETCVENRLSYASVDICDLTTILAALESAEEELATLRRNAVRDSALIELLGDRAESAQADGERLDWLESLYANIRISFVKGASENLAHVWDASRARELIDAARKSP